LRYHYHIFLFVKIDICKMYRHKYLPREIVLNFQEIKDYGKSEILEVISMFL